MIFIFRINILIRWQLSATTTTGIRLILVICLADPCTMWVTRVLSVTTALGEACAKVK